MTTNTCRIEVGGISVEVVRKHIKHLHLGVYPPYGRVRVAAPARLDDEAVRLAVISRLGWIRTKHKSFARQERQSQREMVTGESHFFQGRRYRLRVVEESRPPCVRLVGLRTMELRMRPDSDRSHRETALQRWYRIQLREQVAPLLAKWQPKVGIIVADVRIRKLKTLWGSCNATERRIWLNLELAKKPPSCIEYILVHEMVHFRERHHSELFRKLMSSLMPSWRQYRDELNRAPLAHEDWRY